MTDEEKTEICEIMSENRKIIQQFEEAILVLKADNESHLTLLEAGLEAEESLYEVVDTGAIFYFRHKERQNDT